MSITTSVVMSSRLPAAELLSASAYPAGTVVTSVITSAASE